MADLNLPRLSSPRFVALNPATGRPVSFGTVTFYAAQTTTLRTVYADQAGTVVGPNPATLDAAGSCEVFLSGPYRMVVKDQNGAIVYDADRINSTTRETLADNPGALLAANNLTDLLDPSVARAALGITKQASATDETPGALMAVGAFGLGSTVPEKGTAGALDDVNIPTGWQLVSAANAATVGVPPGAGRGICQTVRGFSFIHQTYYPLETTNSSPWRRTLQGGQWSAWERDYETGSNSSYQSYTRTPGSLNCWHRNAVFEFNSAGSLVFTWNMMKGFSERPQVTVSLDANTGSTLIGVETTALGIIRSRWVDPDTVEVYISRVLGAPNFVAGNQVTAAMLHAVGRPAL
ncbi:hypothetical protein [Amaricoccus solimangrovi]|uniref:Uncharacterized protein n=1 Tax=Amaricoccus solimangrovi TaxID=2589815 RepID=A0A501X0D7_9RHOB|nr:hypothetical protein [Amaricoccus solimangrovi]TPE53081.1 hypothetical protein FJM51_03395 [Amaricoccus solimangrovi]